MNETKYQQRTCLENVLVYLMCIKELSFKYAQK